MSPKIRLVFAWILFLGSLVAWPVSMFTFAKNEPPAVLSLSWFAITLTALDLIATTDVRKQEEEKDDAE